jgi:hypothetical protein
MKLLLEGSLMALVSELVGMVALAKDRASTETHLPANRSFTIISASGAMVIISWWCGTAPPAVWEGQKVVDARANSPEGEGGGVDGEEGEL